MRGACRAVLPAALGLALIGAGCSEGRRPNVLLVVIDTGRADRFSFDGYGRPTSPEIEALAAEGAVYERARTPAPWTLPAHASLFTGLYPSAHGADSGHLMLDPSFVTLAESFHEAGYRTVAYAANPWVGRQYGLDQGFDTYEELWRTPRPGSEDAGAAALNERLLRFFEWRQGNPAAAAQPFFVFVNYLEPHLPYNPPEPWRSRFLRGHADPATVARLRTFKHPDEVRFVLGLGGLDGSDLAILSDLYDGEIAYVDQKVGEVAGALRRLGLLDRTIVVVTSDHGEAIGDHGFLDHKMNVYEELLRIPLVVRYPPAIAAGQRVKDPVMLQDLHPTLLRLAGIPPGIAPRGGTDADRARLLPGIRGLADANPQGRAFHVSEFARPIQFLEIIQQRFPDAKILPWDRALVSYSDGREKLHWASDGRHRLYDLTADPAETNDLAAARPERVRALSALVDSWLRRPAARPPLALPSTH